LYRSTQLRSWWGEAKLFFYRCSLFTNMKLNKTNKQNIKIGINIGVTSIIINDF